MPQSRQPLARRIRTAFVLMTALVSGLFSLGIVASVHFVEAHIVSRSLGQELDGLLQQGIRMGHSPRLDASTRFFSSAFEGYAIPAYLRDMKAGFTEFDHEGNAYYAYVRFIDGDTYMLVEEQNEFEKRETILFAIVFTGFLLSILGAWALGRAMARRVMAPVTRLAMQVRHRDQLHAAAPPLAPEYADDEIGQLARAFDGTLSRIRQSLERERLFTGDVSHELRTPLMVMASSCELLAEAPLGERQREQLARITRAVDEMHELVQTFLQLAREKSDESAASRDYPLKTVAAEEAERWRSQMREKGLDFELVEEEHDDTLYNGIFLHSVIGNLLRNALHYTDHGHVRLVLERGALRIEDSGSGIAATEQQRIFEPFVRGEFARGDGLGLGLSLVQRICSRQGWKIGVRSTPGSGSCFRVSLSSDA